MVRPFPYRRGPLVVEISRSTVINLLIEDADWSGIKFIPMYTESLLQARAQPNLDINQVSKV